MLDAKHLVTRIVVSKLIVLFMVLVGVLIPASLAAQLLPSRHFGVGDSALHTRKKKWHQHPHRPQFNENDTFIVTTITVKGNRRTKAQSAIRQLNIRIGDKLPATTLDSVIERNAQIVYNTRFFNLVTLQYDTLGYVSLSEDTSQHQPADVFYPFVEKTAVYPFSERYKPLHLTLELRERQYYFFTPRLIMEEITWADWLKNPAFHRLSYGGTFKLRNLSGQLDELSLRVFNGYTREALLEYWLPYAIPRWRLDGRVWAHIAGNNEVPYGAVKGVIARVRDRSNLLRQYWDAGFGVDYRFDNQRIFSANIGYLQLSIADTITTRSKAYLARKLQTTEQYPMLALVYNHDYRDYKAMPLQGYKYQVALKQYGVPFFGVSDKVQTTHFTQLTAHGIYYQPLGGRWFTAAGVWAAATPAGRVPYFAKVFTGKELVIRGYESYYIDALHAAAVRSELRFALLARQFWHWSWLPPLFRDMFVGIYPHLYCDAGGVWDGSYNDADPTFKNRLLYGYGGGVQFLLPYDNVLRLEAGTNHVGKLNLQLNLRLALR